LAAAAAAIGPLLASVNCAVCVITVALIAPSSPLAEATQNQFYQSIFIGFEATKIQHHHHKPSERST
jgi:hypothetical protein